MFEDALVCETFNDGENPRINTAIYPNDQQFQMAYSSHLIFGFNFPVKQCLKLNLTIFIHPDGVVFFSFRKCKAISTVIINIQFV